ncbi:MAG: AMMECR1 domain-containing protein [Treponema sp.]|nr:AMMECR1 domain-containing protein [Candidatus Treponema scatequi]
MKIDGRQTLSKSKNLILLTTFLTLTAILFPLTSCAKQNIFVPDGFSHDFSQVELNSLASLARKTAYISTSNELFPYPDSRNLFLSDDDLGIAVRFINNGKDRGCLALYSGLDKKHLKDAVKYCTAHACNDPRYQKITHEEIPHLKINICIFSKWEKMESPYDFILGEESLIVDNPDSPDQDGMRTLLQTAYGTERNFSKDDFLKALCKKAKLEEDAYKTQSLIFYKSKTLTYYDK